MGCAPTISPVSVPRDGWRRATPASFSDSPRALVADRLAHQGSFSVAGAAIEALCRQIATDYGPEGVRAVCIRSAGSPDAPGVDAALTALAEVEGISRDAFEARMAERTLLKHMPRLREIANRAVLAASDLASSMTGVIANGTCGEATD